MPATKQSAKIPAQIRYSHRLMGSLPSFRAISCQATARYFSPGCPVIGHIKLLELGSRTVERFGLPNLDASASIFKTDAGASVINTDVRKERLDTPLRSVSSTNVCQRIFKIESKVEPKRGGAESFCTAPLV